MLIELRRGVTVEPCTFTAIVGPKETIIDMINQNTDLQRYLFLFISCNYSRILTNIHRTSSNFDIRRPFTAHQLQTVLQEVSHSVVFIEHDPTLYDGAMNMIPIIAGILKEISRDTTIILYSPAMDRSFSALTQNAQRLIYYDSADDNQPHRSSSNKKYQNKYQKTLDI